MAKGTDKRKQGQLVKEGITEEFGDDGCDKTASERYGYPVQAHHCICCSVMQDNNDTKMSALAIDSEYDINNGKNCIFLPARFGHMMIGKRQRHRGGHSTEYYTYVNDELNEIYEAVKDLDPCNKDEDKKTILDALMALQDKIYGKLEKRKVWLYDWGERLYTEDYREEGAGDLKSDNQQPSSTDGEAWADQYPKGSTRRKHDGTDVHTQWYVSRGFPVPKSKTA